MFGHPPGLKTLFFTELWERLSYYGMRAILVLFMVDAVETGGFGMSTERAGAIYGLYTAMVYLLALPGGWVADRILGLRRAVFLGGCIIAAGHFSMAIPLVSTFYLGLLLIVLGTGLLKPNISAMVGELYPEGGARRDAGFSIYYMGINIGALIGPLICGFLGETYNWHLGFSTAGVGMVFGVLQYKLGEQRLGDAGRRPPVTDPLIRRAIRSRFLQTLGGLAAVVMLAFLVQYLGWMQLTIEIIARWTGAVIVVIAFFYFAGILSLGHWTHDEKMRIWVIVFLFLGYAIFSAGFEQAGSSMNLFAERMTDRVIGGREFPASWLQSVNPLFIILLAPVFGWLWVSLANRQPSIPVKFAFGLLLLAVGFLVMAWASVYASDTQPVSPAWLVAAYFLHTTGELCLSPVGLSSVTKLSPQPLVGQMMGVWFTAAALGNLMAGLLGGLFEALPLPQLFGAVCVFTGFSGLLFLFLSPPIKRLIGNIQ